jgi:transcriptional regulator with XRE-family HTH domain
MTRLEFMRRERCLTQAAIAEMTLFSRKTILRLESGQIPIEVVHPALRRNLEQFFREPLETLLSPVQMTAPKTAGEET